MRPESHSCHGLVTGRGLFFYFPPRICSGNKALRHLAYELAFMGAERPMIITGKRHVSDGFLKKLIYAFRDTQLTVGAVFEGASHYPSLELLHGLRSLFVKRGCDSLVALGGGAIVDISKLVRLLVSLEPDSMPGGGGTRAWVEMRELIQNAPGLAGSRSKRPLVYVATPDMEGGEASCYCWFDPF